MTVIQKNNHLEAIVEDGDEPSGGVVFFLGDGQEDPGSQSHQIQTPVEVHCNVETGLLDKVVADMTEQQTSGPQASDGPTSPEEAKLDVDREEEKDLDLSHSRESAQCDSVEVNHAGNVVEDVCCEGAETEGRVSSLEDVRDKENQAEPEDEDGVTSKSRETPEQASVVLEEDVEIASRVEGLYETDVQLGQEQATQEGDFDGVKGESYKEEGGSLHSSNESIMKVTDEESVCDEAEESLREELGFDKSSSVEDMLWSEGPNILDLHINGYPEVRDGDAADGVELSGSPNANSAVKAADLTENSDFSVLEASGSPGLAEQKHLEEGEPLPGDCAEVEAC